MKIAVLRQTREGEARMALVPAPVDMPSPLGQVVAVEPGAGLRSDHDDEAYIDAAAVVSHDAANGAVPVVSVRLGIENEVLFEGRTTQRFGDAKDSPPMLPNAARVL